MTTKPRNAPRAQTQAIIFWGQSCVECLLQDFSETGAKIRFSPGFKLRKGEESTILWRPLPNLKPMQLKIRCEWTDIPKGLAGFSWIDPSNKDKIVIRRLVEFHLR